MDDIKVGKITLSWEHDQYESSGKGDPVVFVRRTRKKDPWEVSLYVNGQKYEDKASSLHPNAIRAALNRIREKLRSALSNIQELDSSLGFLDPPPPKSTFWDHLES